MLQASFYISIKHIIPAYSAFVSSGNLERENQIETVSSGTESLKNIYLNDLMKRAMKFENERKWNEKEES